MVLEKARSSDIVKEYTLFIDKLLQDKLELAQKYDHLVVKIKELYDNITRKDEVISNNFNLDINKD